ncbi:hypothetical protein DFP72DRAFT_1143452 [Ephemerocybe angulata]|uniref:lytic cellulose monooxygenase (C4-dehydrogenating) n=1 Tax=Ephemerocybe angulata TaxID=980116 RepID=A0A8H6HNU8_9AGAR|nr:hypothetical protein DFP72DRAFT_1143452 [Tulosesus angulatus]
MFILNEKRNGNHPSVKGTAMLKLKDHLPDPAPPRSLPRRASPRTRRVGELHHQRGALGEEYVGYQPYAPPEGQATISRPFPGIDPIRDPLSDAMEGSNSLHQFIRETLSHSLSQVFILGVYSLWLHPFGPALVYMARCPGACIDSNSRDLKWFKIKEEGLIDGSIVYGNWGNGVMSKTGMYNATIPSYLEAGEYLIQFLAVPSSVMNHRCLSSCGLSSSPGCRFGTSLALSTVARDKTSQSMLGAGMKKRAEGLIIVPSQVREWSPSELQPYPKRDSFNFERTDVRFGARMTTASGQKKAERLSYFKRWNEGPSAGDHPNRISAPKAWWRAPRLPIRKRTQRLPIPLLVLPIPHRYPKPKTSASASALPYPPSSIPHRTRTLKNIELELVPHPPLNSNSEKHRTLKLTRPRNIIRHNLVSPRRKWVDQQPRIRSAVGSGEGDHVARGQEAAMTLLSFAGDDFELGAYIRRGKDWIATQRD